MPPFPNRSLRIDPPSEEFGVGVMLLPRFPIRMFPSSAGTVALRRPPPVGKRERGRGARR